ncbi:serine-rich coiled-coil domain-containing protein 2-like isoform X3 [Gouania willdenowi]|uniref:Serine-rich coiled-coil domain-containing protein 2-like n=2 Tax=Gouania willdenowi TaxID=441366 RepID=A0A8C5HPQ5_GOUWI|nr:serine-rich coiled-coil domain-containing protein 2-like isoform X3 [Gouania willdenowi]
MEEKIPIKSVMVSRLPKFGGRSSSNGSTHSAPPSQDGKATPPRTRPNDVLRTSPFSLKWKKDDVGAPPSPTTPSSPGDGGDDGAQAQLTSLTKEVKGSSPGTPKVRRSGVLMVAISSPKTIPKQLSKINPKASTKFSQCPLNGSSKAGLNSSSICVHTESESRLLRPRIGSISPRSSSQDSLSQSSESLKVLALDNMVRSNSFTHFKQIPSPTSEPMTRSFSFNRAVELAKPLANTQLRPPRSSFIKPPQLSNGRVGLGINGTFGSSNGLHFSRTPSLSSSSTPPAPTTPRTLKKPLLPSCVLNKSLTSSVGSLSYRPTLSGQSKQLKPLVTGNVKENARSPSISECKEISGKYLDNEKPNVSEIDDSYKFASHQSSEDGEGKSEGSGIPEENFSKAANTTVEDMSLSSASSLDRGDSSEDFLNDFDSVEDLLSDREFPDNKRNGNTTQTSPKEFINENTDWDSLDLSGEKDESPMEDSQGPLVLSPVDGEPPQASSLELSPSNSSGGTYMWDEEGLEPLEIPVSHPLETYDDTELNSMDILNNLDHRGTEELDDDLMLDVDLPEDGLHDLERMSQIERQERSNRQGQRRKHHHWIGPDNFNHDNRARVFQHYDGFKTPRIPSRTVPSQNRHHGYQQILDELPLEHMNKDCTLLKEQLLSLQRILQLEDADSPADVSEEVEDHAAVSKFESLIKEVQVLKEELRSRDKTIAQLAMQCEHLQKQQHQWEQMSAQGRAVRCQCNHQRAPSLIQQSDRMSERRGQQGNDKATQTYWRPPSNPGVLPTPLLSPWQAQHQGLTRTSMPQRRQTSNTTVFTPQRGPPPGKTNKSSPHRGPQ